MDNFIEGLLIGGVITFFLVVGGLWVNSLDGEINIRGIGDFERIVPKPEICWESLSKPSTSASDCLKIAESDFEIVCNEIFKDENFCFKLWDNTEISFDPENNKCFMTLPLECGVS